VVNESCFLRAPLATPDYTLCTFMQGLYTTVPLHPMGVGETIGSCIKTAQSANGFGYAFMNSGSLYLALMGDPTLRLFVVAPPTSLYYDAGYLKWTASTDLSGTLKSGEGYLVYHSDSNLGPYDKLTTSGPISDTQYPCSSGYYMVKAIKLEKTGSGTFYNNSQGIIYHQ
jgi:hypothetical protein